MEILIAFAMVAIGTCAKNSIRQNLERHQVIEFASSVFNKNKAQNSGSAEIIRGTTES